MAWKKGQSGNPNGRPKKGTALTELIDAHLKRTVTDIDGKRRNGKRVLARVITEAVLSGSLRFATESKTGEVYTVTEKLDPRDWIALMKYVYDRIDGPVAQKHQHSGEDGGPIETIPMTLDQWSKIVSERRAQAEETLRQFDE